MVIIKNNGSTITLEPQISNSQSQNFMPELQIMQKAVIQECEGRISMRCTRLNCGIFLRLSHG